MAKKAVALAEVDAPTHNIELIPGIEKQAEICVGHIKHLITGFIKAMDEAKAKGDRAPDLIALYRRIYNADEALTEMLKKVGTFKDVFKFKLLPEVYEREQITTLTTAEKDRVNITQAVRASILAENRAKAYAWLRENGNGDIIQETINAGTLGAWVRAELELGRDVPVESFIKHETIDQAALTRGNKPPKP